MERATGRVTGRAAAVGDEEALEWVISLHRLTRSLRGAARTGGLRPTHIAVLALLAQRGEARIGEIAGWVPCSQPTATSAVLVLEAAGLIRRERDPADGRASRVLPTERGAAVLAVVARGESEEFSRRLAALRPQEVRRLLAAGPLLRRLADAAD
ncbi:MarR family winged helix-turn-helix transcriptional regulator [Streptomyces sp. NPDC051567]|uniref:MarR family winged helix-turn-helix transcriptional regulator n=1 Tax=Streptomyces sp. NPDC051567 TaxID=3365660 RepID=UPI0037904883